MALQRVAGDQEVVGSEVFMNCEHFPWECHCDRRAPERKAERWRRICITLTIAAIVATVFAFAHVACHGQQCTLDPVTGQWSCPDGSCGPGGCSPNQQFSTAPTSRPAGAGAYLDIPTNQWLSGEGQPTAAQPRADGAHWSRAPDGSWMFEQPNWQCPGDSCLGCYQCNKCTGCRNCPDTMNAAQRERFNQIMAEPIQTTAAPSRESEIASLRSQLAALTARLAELEASP